MAEVIIQVMGGLVTAVYSDHPIEDVHVVDHDNLEQPETTDAQRAEAKRLVDRCESDELEQVW